MPKPISEFVNRILCGNTLDVLREMPDESVDCVITSPPYFALRDYRVKGQYGLEKTLDEYLAKMLVVTAELKRIMKPTATLWWNHGDSYGTKSGGTQQLADGMDSTQYGQIKYDAKKFAVSQDRDKGVPEKSLLLQNFRLAQRMCDEQQFILRNVIVWWKPNVMPSSVKDRFTVDFEPVFFFSKQKSYYFEPQYEPYTEPMNRWGGDILKADGKSEWDESTGQDTYRDRNMRPNALGRNKRSVWRIPTQPFPEAHFATFPPKLIEPMVKAGCPEFICKKCGKAREKIFDKELINIRPHKLKVGAARESVDTNDPYYQPAAFARTGVQGENQFTHIGYTSCDCPEPKEYEGGIVLDPFCGSGTTAVVAKQLGRNYIGIDISPDYCKMAEQRIKQEAPQSLAI